MGVTSPNFLSIVSDIEPRPLYRIVCESVKIGGLPHGPQNMNQCQEWGMPCVPVLSSLGGDPDPDHRLPADPGTKSEWSVRILKDILESGLKRVKL